MRYFFIAVFVFAFGVSFGMYMDEEMPEWKWGNVAVKMISQCESSNKPVDFGKTCALTVIKRR